MKHGGGEENGRVFDVFGQKTCKMNSCCLFEKDTNSEILLSWFFCQIPKSRFSIFFFFRVFPSLDPELESIIQKRILNLWPNNSNNNNSNFPILSKFKNYWINIFFSSLPKSINRIQSFSLVLISKDYNPEKYSSLLKVMAENFSSSASPVKLSEIFLSVFTDNKFSSFKSSDFEKDSTDSFAPSSLWNLSKNIFSEDSNFESLLLLWTALLLKKKIAVYHDSLPELQKIVRSLANLMSHRPFSSRYDILRPLVFSDEDFSLDLPQASIVASTDAQIKSLDSFDLILDVPSSSLRIMDHSKSDFVFSKMHKDLGNALAKVSNGNGLVQAVNAKTNEIVEKLKTLAEEQENGTLSLAVFHEMGLSETLERFLRNVSIAEGLFRN